MRSLVKGFLSQTIKDIAEENANSPEGIEIAKAFCDQGNWPTKTVWT